MQILQEPDYREKEKNKVKKNWNNRRDTGTDALRILKITREFYSNSAEAK